MQRYFDNVSDLCIVTGSQDQSITVSKVESNADGISLSPWQLYRGHERSIECVAAKSDGTRIVSGGYDALLKVWNTDIGMVFSGLYDCIQDCMFQMTRQAM